MDLARDLLDQQLFDQEWKKIGRVDGVILELRSGRPPRVAAMELGMATLAHRVHPSFERALRRLASLLRIDVEPVRIPLTALRDVGLDIQLGLDDETGRRVTAVERTLAARLTRRTGR
jgi:hypothetical protein